eukprot:gene24322-9928_t
MKSGINVANLKTLQSGASVTTSSGSDVILKSGMFWTTNDMPSSSSCSISNSVDEMDAGVTCTRVVDAITATWIMALRSSLAIERMVGVFRSMSTSLTSVVPNTDLVYVKGVAPRRYRLKPRMAGKYTELLDQNMRLGLKASMELYLETIMHGHR